MVENTTIVVQKCLVRLHAGDESARTDLINQACDRLQRLTRKLMGDFPRIRQWEDSGDVLQDATIRLMRALQEVSPRSPREFFALAALQIRRQLLDLGRRFRGPQRRQLNESARSDDSTGAGYELAAPAGFDANELAGWTDFHECIESLPVEQREVVGLLWYHGLTQVEAAEILNVTERSVKRYWQAARLRLHELMKDRGLLDD